LIKLLPSILFQKYVYSLALEIARPGNQQCANCVGTLSFPINGPFSTGSESEWFLPFLQQVLILNYVSIVKFHVVVVVVYVATAAEVRRVRRCY